jgi:hypothetical protein
MRESYVGSKCLGLVKPNYLRLPSRKRPDHTPAPMSDRIIFQIVARRNRIIVMCLGLVLSCMSVSAPLHGLGERGAR